MTNEEKINRLRNIQRCTPIHDRDDARDLEALETAIEAIETLDKIESRLGNVFEEEDDRLIAVNMFKELEAGIRADNRLMAVSGMSIEELTDAFVKGYRLVSPEAVKYDVSKKGRWIEHEWEEMRKKGYYRCSVCSHGYQRYTKVIRKSDVPYIDGQEYIIRNTDHYCPNCGAKMIEPQESKDKE